MTISQEIVVTKQGRTPLLTEEVKHQSAIHHQNQNQECALCFGLSNPAFPITMRLVNTTWYRGFFGSVEMREKLIGIKSSESQPTRKNSLADKVIALKICLFRCEVGIYFGTSLASIPRALKVYQVIDSFDLFIVFMCHKGDMEGVQVALANGIIHPYATDRLGWTLLTVRDSCKLTLISAEVCSVGRGVLSARIVLVLPEIGFRSRSGLRI